MISCEYISERRPARLEADALELLEAADHQLNVGLDPEPAVSVSQTYIYNQLAAASDTEFFADFRHVSTCMKACIAFIIRKKT